MPHNPSAPKPARPRPTARLRLPQRTRLAAGLVLPVAWAAPEHGRHPFALPGGDALVFMQHSVVIFTALIAPLVPIFAF